MEIGEKLRQARLEAGLSQRQLCGDAITRNMLSLIEHGSARPSMDTLKYLAARLNKPVSFFLEEDGVLLPNLDVMNQARAYHDTGDHGQVLTALEAYRGPDPVFDREKALLTNLALLGLAEAAISEGRIPYARELLRQITKQPYLDGEVQNRQALLLGKTDPSQGDYPSLDEELLIRGRSALAGGNLDRAAALLDAMEDHSSPQWQLTRGEICLRLGDYSQAAQYLHRAEETFPRDTAKLLEVCCRELGDFKQAYFYACRQK